MEPKSDERSFIRFVKVGRCADLVCILFLHVFQRLSLRKKFGDNLEPEVGSGYLVRHHSSPNLTLFSSGAERVLSSTLSQEKLSTMLHVFQHMGLVVSRVFSERPDVIRYVVMFSGK
jgi:hypothetical protein